MEPERVVICLSTYNGERFLSEQLDSLLGQTYQNWLLVVHDDGSSDETMHLLHEYAMHDSRIHLRRGEGKLGIKKGFLTSLIEADGDYYAFCDQDDVWHQDKLAVLVNRFATTNSAVPTLMYSDYQEIDAEGRDITDYTLKRSYKTDFGSFLLNNTATGCTCMLNRSLRDTLVSPLEDIDYSAIDMHDWWAALVASALGQVIFVDKRLISYRQHGANVLGAPSTSKLSSRVGRFLRLDVKHILYAALNQDRQLLRLYSDRMSGPSLRLAQQVVWLTKGWNPSEKRRVIRVNRLSTGTRFADLEMSLILTLPPILRPKLVRSLHQ